jgi:hypothetical protein
MQQAAEPAPAETAPSFAGLLAALAAPSRKGTPAWSDDDLEDDIATLSYERALRSHARHRPADDRSGMEAVDPAPIGTLKELRPPLPPANQAENPHPAPIVHAAGGSGATPSGLGTSDRNLKHASITIRMSHEECAQLRKRAAEAGLTVSAYLRSCTFEAESLRALVKDTLAQLRSAQSARSQDASAAVPHSWKKSLRRFLPL